MHPVDKFAWAPSRLARGDDRLKGLRYLLRNFTALAVREHLRSQIERPGDRAELTPNEAALVGFAAGHLEQLAELATKSTPE